MIKRILSSMALWLGILILLLFLLIINNSIMALVLAVIWFLLPLLNFILNIFAAKNVNVTLTSDAATSKNKRVTGSINLKNTGKLPVFKAFCQVEIDNRLTGEQEKIYVPVSVPAKEKNSYPFEIVSAFCGYIKIRAKCIYLMDLFGILPVKKKYMAKTGISVFPDTFSPVVYLNISMTEKDDAEKWSQYKKGNDQNEMFALREYVPGDSLKQIHWKMSAKRQQLTVKEASMPIEKTLLIFWNKNVEKGTAKEMDAMAESICSVAQSILENGVPFTLGWTEESGTVFESVDTDEQLQQAIPKMLKRGFAPVEVSIPYEEINKYSKIIYMAKVPDKTIDAFECTDKTILLCTDQMVEYNLSTIVFSADNYIEDLQFIEL